MGSAFLSDNSGAVGLPFEKWLGRLMESTNMTKMSLWFEGFFVCSPFVLGELALYRVLEDYSLSKSNRKSDNVGLPLGEY